MYTPVKEYFGNQIEGTLKLLDFTYPDRSTERQDALSTFEG
jgi:hypothetical protein